MKSLRRSLNNEKSTSPSSSSHVHHPSASGISAFTNNSSSSAGGPRSHTPNGMSSFPPGSTNAHASSSSAHAIASTSKPLNRIAPPQKVIRAIHTHRSEFPQFPSYSQGEFFYVTNEVQGDEANPEGWYEALNPITGSRGRVIRAHFEEFGKTGRVTSGSGGASGSSNGGHGQEQGPGYASSRPTSPTIHESENSIQPSLSATLSQNGSPHGNGAGEMRSAGSGYSNGNAGSPGVGGGAGSPSSGGGGKPNQPLYAIVQYDFVAERPDELDAKAGEPIIVIAQSNHEWFVAKPIGRLGGPGLIPVSFVEIRDPRTSRPVENVQELLATGGVPQVEAWKKATAEYKAASIPLGQFDFSQNKQGVQNSPYAPQDESGRPNGPTRQDSHGNRSTQNGSNRTSWAAQQRYNSQPPHLAQGGNMSGGASQTDTQLTNGDIISTHVRSFHFEASEFWFRINVIFMPDDPSLQAISLVLYKLYEDFYNFQITLLDVFPSEAGRAEPTSAGAPPGSPPAGRILPYMPGPLDEINVDITNQRREELDTYLKELLELRNIGAGYILRHPHVLAFFSPGAGDQAESLDRLDAEVIAEKTMREGGPSGSAAGSARHMSGTSGGLEEKLSELRMSVQKGGRGSGGSSPMPQAHGLNGQFEGRGSGGSGSASIRSGSGNAISSGNGGSRLPPISSAGHDSGPQRGHSPIPPTDNGSSQNTSAGPFSPPIHTASTQSSFGSGPGHARSGSTAVIPVGPAAPTPAFIKIKILERTTDDMIAIRVPPKVTFEQLMQKVRDRLGSQVGRVQYRQSGGGAAGAATFRDIGDDESLKEWLGKEDKLVLYAD